MRDASRTQATSWFVCPAIAETTTATWFLASYSRLTCRATLRMRSMLATDVPPNFITTTAMRLPVAPISIALSAAQAVQRQATGASPCCSRLARMDRTHNDTAPGVQPTRRGRDIEHKNDAICLA